MANLVGARIERKEDKKFLTGKGRYTADINLVDQTYAYFIRSPHARAQISSIDTAKASKASGVVKILTGEDIIKDKIGGLIAGWAIKSEDGSPMKVPPHPPLAKDTVNYVGDHVAVVIAETLQQAKNAAELVKVNYKVLKAVVNTAEAMNSNAIYKDIEKIYVLIFCWEIEQKLMKLFKMLTKSSKLILIITDLFQMQWNQELRLEIIILLLKK